MKVKFALLMLPFLFAACASNPNKAEKIKTEIDKSNTLNSEDRIGVKDGNMVFQRKVLMAEELRKLQIDTYTLEDKVFGNRNYGSSGLYGVLRNCRADLADKKNGGDGKLMWTEPLERVTKNEEEFVIGLDEKDQLVGVKEEFLKDRIQRFRGYRNILEKRQDEYEEKIAICKTELKSRSGSKSE